MMKLKLFKIPLLLGLITLVVLICLTFKTGNATRTNEYINVTNSSILMQDAFRIIATIESNKQPDAINKRSKAYGVVQIRTICIKDINLIYGTNYTKDDAFNTTLAYKMFVLYTAKYCKNLTIYEIARVWNGGCNSKKLNKSYKRKIEKLAKNYNHSLARQIKPKSFLPNLNTKMLWL